MNKINKELVEKAVKWIERDAVENPDSRYTFDVFCKEHNLYNGNEKKLGSGDIFILCPFHSESTPSLAINETRRIWNCLGCGRGGKYIDFLKEYSNTAEGYKCSWFQKVNELVSSDTRLQEAVGAKTVFMARRPFAEEYQRVPYKKYRQKKTPPDTFLKLASEMQKRKASENSIKLAILSMQNGFSPETIYQLVYGSFIAGSMDTGVSDAENVYDVNKIMEES